MSNPNRYILIIEKIFERNFKEGLTSVNFERKEIISTARELDIDLPLNIGDIIYSFKFRTPLPPKIQEKAPEGKQWVIVSKGRSLYAFEAKNLSRIIPDPMLTITKIPDATPGIVMMYALDDEQALLTKLRYNRLLDIFTGVTCYSLQNHLRTTVQNIGQVETDEIYVGIDKKGAQYVFPVQAKGGTDELGVVQIEQDIALCLNKFPNLKCRAIAAQFMQEGVIAMFEFNFEEGEIRKEAERHYKLVPVEQLSIDEIQKYQDKTES
jgi:hypothetical protein